MKELPKIYNQKLEKQPRRQQKHLLFNMFKAYGLRY